MTASGLADIDIRTEHAGWADLDLDPLVVRAIAASLRHLGLHAHFEVSVLATGDEQVARLNGEFRGKLSATNVLSWPARDLSPESPGGLPALPTADEFGDLTLGDIALAYETCAEEAKVGNKSLNDHTTHLVVHAFLHLLGYDHISDKDAAVMEGLEAKILADLGLPNPYADDA